MSKEPVPAPKGPKPPASPAPPPMPGFKLLSIGRHPLDDVINNLTNDERKAIFDAFANDRIERHYSVSFVVTGSGELN